MKIGVFGTSKKKNEKRYPLYWEHLKELSEEQIRTLYFEEGYPGIENLDFIPAEHILPRKALFKVCNFLIIPKPEKEDLDLVNPGTTIFGWPHAVQGTQIAQYAIDKKLTLIAWEAMYRWVNGEKREHIFARNNELAGYAGVNHFMELNGITPGTYGREMKVAVLGYGSTARGAVNSILGLGAVDVTVFSKRTKFQLIDCLPNIKYKQYSLKNGDVYIENIKSNQFLLQYDLIINCILQDPTNPIVFMNNSDLDSSKKIMIIDISCDKGMGFDFAEPTSFEKPLIVTDKYIYYSVDHTPTYYWNSASYEISGALLPFMKHLITNKSYKNNITLEKAVEIENGVIINKKILVFQKRETEYPYLITKH